MQQAPHYPPHAHSRVSQQAGIDKRPPRTLFHPHAGVRTCGSPDLDNVFPLWEHKVLRIIREKRVKDFGRRYPDSALALANWIRAVRAARWSNQADVRGQFHDSDLVGEKTVFNIARDRYRLIAFVAFQTSIVYVKAVLSHKE